MKFFNREKEIKEITSILEGEPNQIYFTYGSINSGKTTLINHIINEKLKNNNKKKYAVFYVNFREYDISSMDNFVEALFEIDENSKDNKMKSYIEYFTRGVNDISNLYYGIKVPEPLLNRLFGEKEKGRLVFKFIRDLFMSLNNKGIQPVFILDELQISIQNIFYAYHFTLKQVTYLEQLRLLFFLDQANPVLFIGFVIGM